MEIGEIIVRSMLDPDHHISTEKLHSALALLGKGIIVGIEDARRGRRDGLWGL